MQILPLLNPTTDSNLDLLRWHNHTTAHDKQHKELRFIIYVLPVFNAAAAVGVCRLWQMGDRDSKCRWQVGVAARLVVRGALATTLLTTIGFTYISSINYPGGDIFAQLHTMCEPQFGAWSS
jgi:hypothetical protein